MCTEIHPQLGVYRNCNGKIPEGLRISPGARIENTLGLDKASADGISNKVGHAVHVELMHDVAAMGIRGLYTDPKRRCNLFCRLALRNKLKHLEFARSEGLGFSAVLLEISFHDGLRNSRAQVNPAFEDLVDCFNQFGGGPRLEHIAADTGPQRFQDVPVLRVDGQEDDFRRWHRLSNLCSRFDAGHDGHPDVHYHQIGLQFGGARNSFSAVRRFSGNLEAFAIQDRLQALQNNLVVVGNKYPDTMLCHLRIRRRTFGLMRGTNNHKSPPETRFGSPASQHPAAENELSLGNAYRITANK